MKDYAKMTKAELLRRIAALEKTASGPAMAFAHERLIHDLQVQQAELETQNRELRAAQQLVEMSRDRYADLFDFAPVGYVTLDDKGVIREINLTAAGLLGGERARLVGAPFHLHVARADLAEFRAHLRDLTEPDQHTAAELQLIRKGRDALPVLMQSMLGADAEPGSRLYRTTITDLTARKQAEAALRDNEARLSAILDTAAEGIITIDEHGSIESINLAAQKIFGYTDAEAVGRNVSMLRPAPEGGPPGSSLPPGPAKIIGIGREVLGRRQDGSTFPMDLSISDVELAAHRIVTWFIRDLTERMQAEQALQASEERLRLVLQATEMGTFELDLPTGEGIWNAVEFGLLGLQPGDAPASAETFLRFVHPDDAGWLRAAWEEAVRTGEFDAEFRIVRADGEERWLAGKGRLASKAGVETAQAGEQPLRFLGVNFDITERKRADEALRSRSQQQQAVAEFGQHALAGRGLARLFQDAVALVPLVLGVEFGKVLELRHASGDLLLRAGTGWKKGLVGRTTVSGGRDSQAGCTLLANAPIVVEDYAQESRFPMPPLLAKHGIRSGVSVVIHTRGRPYGVLGAHGLAPRSFSGDDVHFVQAVANTLAAAIDRHDLEEELLKASDDERARIGQDLHDDLCQQLTGIELRTEVLKHRLADLPAAREEAEKIGGYVRVAMLHARTLAYGLSPVQLDANGLMSALHELVANIAELFSVDCEFRCDSPVLIADQFVATHLYRIAQEAISNAIRHGHARHVAVSLAPSPEGGVLTVADDGSGCSTTIWESTGMGLRIMHYRSEMIGATLRLEPGAGGGTAVICEFQAP